MCVGFLASITYLYYPVLMCPKKNETAVHCFAAALSVLITLISGNVFDVASALQSISCLELANQRSRHSGYKHMLYNNNNKIIIITIIYFYYFCVRQNVVVIR